MWRDIEPDERIEVNIEGHKLVAYSFGTGDDVLFLVNGGPGLPCDYLREAHSCFIDQGFRVVAFDQLDCGASDRPNDPSLWTLQRYVRETEAVRRALGLGKVHFLGHSWGGWQAIEYALTYPDGLASLILSSTVADMVKLRAELDRLKAALGPEAVAMMQRHEAEGTFTHPEYMGAITMLNYRHVCRLQEAPAPVERSLKNWNMGPYSAIQGPNEFLYIGNIRNWSRLDDLHKIDVPVLITAGQYDEQTPACALEMKLRLKNAQLNVFPNSSHVPFYEDPELYYPVLRDFLEKNRLVRP
ncbi:proline iminopeptidase-family hydrolase [Aestuariivirga sp.]|uniref:proline iminopeptidase-family hydrolase n=1 Tax=Aestuariivirga sp. TaxID=2650926 RepID=UPI00359452F9